MCLCVYLCDGSFHNSLHPCLALPCLALPLPSFPLLLCGVWLKGILCNAVLEIGDVDDALTTLNEMLRTSEEE